MIPVYVNTFNRLTTTRTLCEQIAQLDNALPIIVDNDSDYGPLLEWYSHCPFEIVRLRENLGHHAPWISGVIAGDAAERYVVTDCDLDLSGVPADVLSVLAIPFTWTSQPIKSGLAMRIDDIPKWQTDVRSWESRWWTRRVTADPRFYHAAIDTTFAMYQGHTPHRLAMQVATVPAVRLAGQYQCRHVPWYLDGTRLDAENQQYFATASESNSWKPSGQKLKTEYGRRKK